MRDAKYGRLKEETRPTAYTSYVQLSRGAPNQMTFSMRTAGDPAAMTTAIQKAVQSVEPKLPILAVKTQEEQIARRRGAAPVRRDLDSCNNRTWYANWEACAVKYLTVQV